MNILLTCLLAAAAPPVPRFDTEGEPLPEHAVARIGSARLRTSRAAALHPDGKRLTVYDGATVIDRDIVTGRRLGKPDNLPLPAVEPRARILFRYNRRGDLLACGPNVGVVRDAATHLTRPFAHPGDPLALSDDGDYVASLDRHDSLAVTHTRSGRPLFSVPRASGLHGVEGVVRFSPDGRTLAVGRRNDLRLYDAATGRLRAVLDKPVSDNNLNRADFVYIDDGSHLLLHVGTGWAVYRNADLAAVAGRKTGGLDRVFGPLWCDATHSVLSLNGDDLYRHDLRAGTSVRLRGYEMQDIRPLEASGGRLLLRTASGYLVADTRTGAPLTPPPAAPLPTPDVPRLPEPPYLFFYEGVGIGQPGFHVVATGDLSERWSWEADSSGPAFDPACRFLAVGGYRLRLCDAATGGLLRTWEYGGSPEWSGDGRCLCLIDGGEYAPVSPLNEVRVYEIRSGSLRHGLRPPSFARRTPPVIEGVTSAASFSRDGSTLAACSDDGMVVLHRLDGTSPPARLALDPSPRRPVFSPDGRFLAAVGGDDVHILDSTGKTLAVFAPGDRSTFEFAFLADGRHARTTHHDGTALLWRIPDEVAPLDPSREASWSALRGEPAAARAAVAELVRGGDNAVSFLEGRLSDSDELRAVRAIEVLERVGSAAAVAHLHRLAAAKAGTLAEEAVAALIRIAERETP